MLPILKIGPFAKEQIAYADFCAIGATATGNGYHFHNNVRLAKASAV